MVGCHFKIYSDTILGIIASRNLWPKWEYQRDVPTTQSRLSRKELPDLHPDIHSTVNQHRMCFILSNYQRA